MFVKTSPAVVGIVVAATLVLGGCAKTSPTAAGGGRLAVTAAFYPLEYAARRVGGTHVTVTGLTRAGAEPHDLELTPRQVVDMHGSDVIVYERRFQPAVDDAVDSIGGSAGFDVSAAARLLPAADGGGATGLTNDPHFWLDPTRYADVVSALGAELATKDPTNAADYRANATVLVEQLTALDAEFARGLANCRNTTIVTGHAAFGYLAQRYGLTQVSVAGLSPDIEPTAAQMSDIVRIVEREHVTTVYAETLVSPALVETIARESGAEVAVLDPVAGITDQSAGKDYLEVMRANLATLEKGQGCT